MATGKDWYQEVTDRIVATLEAGTVPWVKPWSGKFGHHGAMAYNGASGRPYHGINAVLLGMSPYASCEWFTFNQAKELGGCVRKGEKGSPIVFFKEIRLGEDKREDDKDDGKRLLIRGWHVFNRDQIDGLPDSKRENAPAPKAEPDGRRADVDAVIKATGATIRHGGDRACYRSGPGVDEILMPIPAAFCDFGAYYATATHELGHWTGHAARLDRDLSNRFGSHKYAAEELIAEMTSAFLCARLGIDGKLQHPEYIASWLDVMKADKRAVVTAASKAQKAALFIMPEGVADADDETEAA